MNILRLSPKSEAKKRRAPALPGAPTPSMGHSSFEGYEVRDKLFCVVLHCGVKFRHIDEMMQML